MNFRPQTASNWTIFAHPPNILRFYSLPGVADVHQQPELNQTVTNGGQ